MNRLPSGRVSLTSLSARRLSRISMILVQCLFTRLLKPDGGILVITAYRGYLKNFVLSCRTKWTTTSLFLASRSHQVLVTQNTDPIIQLFDNAGFPFGFISGTGRAALALDDHVA